MNSVALPVPVQREILVELNRLHARVLRRMPLVQAMVAMAVVYSNHAYVPMPTLLQWAAATMAVELLRAWVAARVLAAPDDPDPRRTLAVFVLLAACSGLAVGALWRG